MSNTRRILLLSLVIAALLSACTTGSPGYSKPDWEKIPDQLPASLKGYELYSWQVNEEWIFTMTTGTNRSKSFEEITSTENEFEDEFVKITVTDLQDLETLLARLPAGTEVFWSGIDLTGQVEEGTLYFSYPPQETVTEITKWAEELDLELHTLQQP